MAPASFSAACKARSLGSPRSGAQPPAPSDGSTSYRVSTQEGLLAEFPRPAGRVLFAGAEGARRLLVNELEADFVALYRTRELTPESPRTPTSSSSRPLPPPVRSRV